MSPAMPFRPMIVIPCYNHGAPLMAVLAELEQRFAEPLPCLVVDDGSDLSTRHLLEQACARYGWLTAIHLEQNQGKGRAVLAGLRHAAAQGYSHGLQLDADGQHDLSALPRLLQAAEAEPQALISGQPEYDDSVPRSRLYGRYITHVWVWIETASLAIRDSMCGFRAYPLAATLALADRVNLGARMDFDTDVMVRLFWQGVPVRFIPLRVIYPPDGLSHFDLWRDNLRISWMHTRLVCERLLTLAGWRASQRHWSRQPERGASWGLKLMLASYRLLGRRGFTLLLYPVIAYFWATGGSQRRASAAYLARLEAYAARQQIALTPARRTTFAHFMQFGVAQLDRLSGWSGQITRSDIVLHGEAELSAAMDSGKGVLVLGAHLGNLELCRALGRRYSSLVINALVFTEHAARYQQQLEQVSDEVRLNLLPVSSLGPETAILLKSKLDAGEWVVVMGDRTSVTREGRVLLAPLLGEPAPFPLGPFALASVLEVPVALLFALRQQQRHHIYFEPFSAPLHLKRAERQAALQQLVERYAARLEYHLLRSPLEWFNFFDFWHLSDDQHDA